MKIRIIAGCLISLLIILNSKNAYADSAIDFYRSFIQGYPSVQSYSLKSQALEFENQNLNQKRFLNPTATTLYSNYQTQFSGNFSITAFSVANTIDVFNKTGIDKQKNKLEIKRNILLTKMEKKDIFSTILNAYANVVKNKYLLRIHESNLILMDKNILFIKKGIDTGIFPDTELARWNIERLNQINLIESDKLEIIKAEETLRLHSGVEGIITNDIDTGKLKNIQLSDISEPDFIKNSPEIETLNIDQKQLELDIKKENRDLLPDLQISDSYELNKDPSGNGNQNIAVAALNFILPNGGRETRIKSDKNKIGGIELDKEAQIILLKNTFRGKIMEMCTEKNILSNLEIAVNISEENLNKLFISYKKRFIDYSTLVDAIKEHQTIQENYVSNLITLDQNYEYLYHLSKGDIY